MQVLQSIETYMNDLKKTTYVSSNQIDSMKLLCRYCKQTDPYVSIEDIDAGFFDEFFLYWLPKKNYRLPEETLYSLFPTVQKYCEHIGKKYRVDRVKHYQVVGPYMQELFRIYYVQKQFGKFLNDPILCTEPLIIDLYSYKKSKVKKTGYQDCMGIFEQGLFEVVEVGYDCSIGIKKIPSGRHAKVLLDEDIVSYLRKGDILHLRMKRKMFFTYWEIQEMKGCFLSQAQHYLS